MTIKPQIFARARFFVFALTLVLAALSLSGCWNDTFVWSPDGSHATVIAPDGLRLSDVEGTLSSLLVPNAYGVAWLSDSKRIVVARKRPIKDFAEIAAKLGPEHTARVVAIAKRCWTEIKSSPETSDNFLETEPFEDRVGAYFYLLKQHGALFRKKMGETKDSDFGWHSLTMANVKENRIELGALLYEGLVPIHSIRPSPGANNAVAFVIGFPPGHGMAAVKDLQLLLTSTHTSVPATLVATHTAALPDWTPDGRTLLFFKATDDLTPKNGELALGALVEQTVLDAEGHLSLSNDERTLVSLIFQSTNTVRCLNDGRVIFNATEIQFPAPKEFKGRDQLFVVNRSSDGHAITPLIPKEKLQDLPKSMEFFDVSPDETQILFLGEKSDVWLFTITDGKLETFVGGFDKSGDLPLPAWRGPGQFVYARNAGTTEKPSLEIVLQGSNEKTIWSHNWPSTVLNSLSGKAPETGSPTTVKSPSSR